MRQISAKLLINFFFVKVSQSFGWSFGSNFLLYLNKCFITSRYPRNENENKNVNIGLTADTLRLVVIALCCLGG